MRRILGHSILSCAMALCLWGGSALAQDAGVASSSALEQIKKRGTLRVGMAPTLPPAVMRSKDGKTIGFEADVANRLAKDMGVKVEIVPSVWDGLIPGLISSKSDVIISWMTMTPARNLTVNFSDSYSGTGMYLTGNKKLAGGLKSIAEFNKPSITLAVMRGSTTATVAKRLMPNSTIREFEDQTLMVQEVLNGQAHGFLASAPRPQFEILANPDKLFLPMSEPLVRSAEGIAVRKGDPDLLNFLNNWIFLRLRDGWLKERRTYWFETRDWADMVGQK